jgi:hypothetical protein
VRPVPFWLDWSFRADAIRNEQQMTRRKREAYIKQISERLKQEDKVKKERDDIYQNRRKQ